MTKTLRDWVPSEFFSEHMSSNAAKYLDWNLVEEHGISMFVYDEEIKHEFYIECPIKRANIHNWCIVEKDGKYRVIAWNENPSRGWSFLEKNLSSPYAIKRQIELYDSGYVYDISEETILDVITLEYTSIDRSSMVFKTSEVSKPVIDVLDYLFEHFLQPYVKRAEAYKDGGLVLNKKWSMLVFFDRTNENWPDIDPVDYFKQAVKLLNFNQHAPKKLATASSR